MDKEKRVNNLGKQTEQAEHRKMDGKLPCERGVEGAVGVMIGGGVVLAVVIVAVVIVVVSIVGGSISLCAVGLTGDLTGDLTGVSAL